MISRVRNGALGALLLASSLPAMAQAAAPAGGPRLWTGTHNPRTAGIAPERVPGEIVVRYRPSVGPGARDDVRARAGGRLTETLPASATEVVTVAPGRVDEAVGAYESSDEVLFAEPNYIYRAATLPNDPRFPESWALNNSGQVIAGVGGTPDADMDVPEAWNSTTGNRSVVVAVLDTGVAFDHPDLAPNMWTNPGETGMGKESNGKDDDGNGLVDDWRGWDWVQKDNKPRDLLGHGTHVAGIVGAAGNDGSGMSGVAWKVSIMPLRVLDAQGTGTTSDVASAIDYARAKGADIVNLSLGGPDLSLSVSNAITAASETLVVAAAGNEGSNNDLTPSYPCNYPAPNVLCVGATDQNDALAGYSNFGGTVDVAAPGSRILSTLPAFSRALRETFESPLGAGWTTGGEGTPWSRATDELGGFAQDSPENYAANSTSWLRSPEVNLSGLENCQLSYVFRLDTESKVDFLTIEVGSGDVWQEIGARSGSTGGDWLTAAHDLSSFDGKVVSLRFSLVSNALFEQDGAALDDIQVKCLSSDYSGSEFGMFSGTSMATPHASGVAALALAGAPDTTSSELKNALVAGVDELPGLLGKTASGGRVNAARTLGVVGVSSVPKPGPSPTAEPSASPTTVPDPLAEEPHARTINLSLRRHLQVRGHVAVADGFEACINDVIVTITRNGAIIKQGTTSATGAFRFRVKDRPGRYRASVSLTEVDGGMCGQARSRADRHSH